MEIPGHFRTNYKKIMKFQDIPGQKDKKKIQYHFSLKNKKAHIPGGSRKILDFGPSKLLEITFSALIFSTCRCTLDAILKFTCLKWLKMSSNSPPWLEKILKFTCLKWLKMAKNFIFSRFFKVFPQNIPKFKVFKVPLSNSRFFKVFKVFKVRLPPWL